MVTGFETNTHGGKPMVFKMVDDEHPSNSTQMMTSVIGRDQSVEMLHPPPSSSAKKKKSILKKHS